MQSEVEFKNRSAEQIKVIPKGKSQKRWEQLTIYPGGGYNIKDSIVDAFDDIQFDVYARPKGGRVDELIGEFGVDNPSLAAAKTWNLSPGYAYKAVQGSFTQDGKVYKTMYPANEIYSNNIHRRWMPLSDNQGIIGIVDPTKADYKRQEIGKKAYSYDYAFTYYSLDTNAAFDKSLPYIEHSYLGEGYGTKAWQFTFKDWA